MIVYTYVANAIDMNWGWTIGSVGYSYDVINNEKLINVDLLKTDLILAKKIDIGISIFSMYFQNKMTNDIEYAFLPIEVGFLPFTSKYVNISLYGRGQWQFVQAHNVFLENLLTPKGNEFYGAIGVRLFAFFPDNILHYSWHSSLFLEYTTSNEFKIGVTLEPMVLGVVITGFAIGILKGEYEQKKEEQERMWNKKPNW
jgi:hypothetical protein